MKLLFILALGTIFTLLTAVASATAGPKSAWMFYEPELPAHLKK
ncbi:MAG: AgrD family cyclic lactone autoinducer peptide [Eubacteriales bacterium]